MATYPSTLEEFIYLSIYLLTYLRGNGHPPDYVGGNATCTHLCRREWSPVYLSTEEWPLILSIYLSTERWAPIYQSRIGWTYPFILEDRIYLATHLPMYLSWRRWPTLPTYSGGDGHLYTYIIRKDSHLPVYFGGIYLLIYPPIQEKMTNSTHLFKRGWPPIYLYYQEG